MRCLFALPVLGTPVTGLSPVFSTWRQANGSAATVSAPTIHELSSSNAPGWYYFDVDTDEHIVATVDGTSTLSSTYRYLPMELRPGDVRGAHDEVVVYSDWDARGNPTAGTVYVYQNPADLVADTDRNGAAARFTFTATYDASNRLTQYTRSRLVD